MNRYTICSIMLMIALGSALPALGENGLINVKSVRSVEKTVQRLTAALEEKGMNVFLVVDHAEGARSVGKELRPTTLVIFGNPKVGSGLMAASQPTGIDLPQKALIWEDASGQVWLTYNNPDYLAGRHGLPPDMALLQNIKAALKGFAGAATGP